MTRGWLQLRVCSLNHSAKVATSFHHATGGTSARLGHGSIRTTQEICSHMIHGQDDEAARRWEEFGAHSSTTCEFLRTDPTAGTRLGRDDTKACDGGGHTTLQKRGYQHRALFDAAIAKLVL